MTAFHASVADFVVVVVEVVGGEIINVTGTVYVHQAIFIVTVALRVPAASPLVFTAAVSFALVVRDVVAGDTVSHVALSEVVIVADPEAVREKVIVWFGGFVAPCTA